jgi:hypothetical protein
MKRFIIIVLFFASVNSAFSNNKWFVGVGVGQMFNSKESSFERNVGGSGGTIINTRPSIEHGSVYEALIGYHESKNILLYLSYQYFGNYDYKFDSFDINGGGDNSDVFGKLTTQTITLNVNYLLNPLSFDIKNVKFIPYIGAGIGLAFNELKEGKEVESFGGSPFATVAGHTHKGFAGHARVGLNASINKNIDLGLEYELTITDRFESGSYRTFNNGSSFPIVPYETNDIFYNAVKLKFLYNF